MTLAATGGVDAALARLLPTSPVLTVLSGPQDADAAEHASAGPELLRRTAARARGSWLRCYSPPSTAAFSAKDRSAPGYDDAREAARRLGFTPVQRGRGGRMAAYHRACLCLDLVLAEDVAPDPWVGLEALAQVLVVVLREAGVDARVGPVPGEYCPGRFSVNNRGVFKLGGTAARRVPGATLLSAMVVVDDPAPIRDVVAQVYRVLPLSCDPDTVGAVTDAAPGLDVSALTEGLFDTLTRRVDVTRPSPLAVSA